MSYLENIPKNWKFTTIDNEAIVVTDYVANGSFASLKENVTYLNGEGYARLIRLTDHNNQYNGEGIYVNEHSYKFLKKSKIEPNDIIISNVGEYSGTVFKAPDLKMPMTLGPNSILVKFKDSQDFMFYFLQCSIGQHLINTVKSGSANPKFNKTEFKKIEFVIPPPIEQKSIAAILSAFDDKIELLKEENKTLEVIAQTIFTEWFGKYQFGDELPEGWIVEKLEEIAFHSKDIIKPFDNPNKEYIHFSLPAYDNGLNPVIEKGIMIKSSKYTVKSDSFLVSKLNPFTPRIWTIYKSAENYICSTEFQVIKPKQALFFSIIHCFLNSDYFTKELSQKIKGTSSSHQRVNPQDIFDVKLIIPNKSDLIKFNECLKPIIQKKDINHSQIQTLTLNRDELLPKLMIGEIRVSEFNK